VETEALDPKTVFILEAIKNDRLRRESWGRARECLAEQIMRERGGSIFDSPSPADYDAAYRLIRAYKALGVE